MDREADRNEARLRPVLAMVIIVVLLNQCGRSVA
jgi:hypothetical protein